jgi:hypothetical protein
MPAVAVPKPLAEELELFLAAGPGPADHLLLLLGEPGSGKSMFVQAASQRYLAHFMDLMAKAAAPGSCESKRT